ncbi:MAG: TonB-dependent receptor [Bacteroidales bacterium]|nr:TonB-dependent receptor [Bacteroidales bacterium]
MKILLAAVLLFAPQAVFAQRIDVSGLVTDKDGAPVVGAGVFQKGARSNGTITDLDGRFVLSVPAGATLVVSSIGYKDAEQPASAKMTVVLEEDNELLEEVVVVGYGVQKKVNLTGAISSVGSEDIQGRSIAHVEQALQGKTPGVTLITTSAQPGAVPTVRVRGIASNGTSDPLYVVDGLLMEDISSIDPNSIESMEVLKDAASAAIYGAQAGNGVILITTKKGTKGQGSITYDFQYNISSLAIKPQLLNSKEYIQQAMEANPLFTDDDVLRLIDLGTWDGKSSTDWLDVTFGNGIIKRHTLSAQGGNDRGSYFLTLGSYDEDGTVKLSKDTYKRYTVSLNADYQIKKWAKVGTTLDFANYSVSPLVDGVPLGGSGVRSPNLFAIAMYTPPYLVDRYAPDQLPEEMKNLLAAGKKLLTDDEGNYYTTLGLLHPEVAVKSAERRNYGNRLSGTMFANITPFKGLVFTSRFGFKVYTDNSYYFIHEYYGGENYFNEASTLSVNRSSTSTTYYQWENFANYAKSLGKHTIGVTAGMSYSHNTTLYTYAGISNAAKDDPLYADVSYPAGDVTRSTEGKELYNAKLSYFGRVNYNYADKYLLEATLRADAADSSVLPIENRWGYFPSVSAGWIISGEDFFSSLKESVSFLKVRASWGQNGSTSNLGGYKYSNSISTTAAGYSYSNSAFTYQTKYVPAQLANPGLKWETSEQLDFGLDLRMFKDRLSLTADWFKKDTKDLIIQKINVPYEAGNIAAPVNGGNITNNGVELELSWKDQIGDFFYSVSGNIATLNNMVTWLNPNVSDSRIMSATSINFLGAPSAFEVGYPIWYFRGYKVDHLDENGDPVIANLSGDAEGSIDENDKTMIGKPLPDFTYGLTITLGWKGFDFTLFANGSQGNDMFMCYNNASLLYGLKSVYDQRWTPSHTNTRFARPQASTATINQYLLSDAFIFDGSYFRIKQIQLGYTVPQTLTRKAAIEKLRVFASLDNYFLFTSYPGLDPEISTNAVNAIGLDLGAYPTTKKMVFGVSVTF